ncbi:MAG TPA: hypothetical protein VFX54_10585 [Candidatus Binatia bacterium]|jgi:uncharacterized protein (UPF0261 family)|nr:hypothetical protein [Candidatus Binatia bacterium]
MEPGFNYSRRDPKSNLPSFRVSPWVGSIHVYVDDVDAVYGRAIRLGAKTMFRQKTHRTTSCHINDPQFAEAIVDHVLASTHATSQLT